MLPAAWLSGGPYTHAEIAVSRLLRFGSTPDHGIRLYPANIAAFNSGGTILYAEMLKTRQLGLARLNWSQEFTLQTIATAPRTFQELSRQLQMFLANLEHDR